MEQRNEKGAAQKLINVLIGIILCVFGWMGNTIWSIVQTQQEQLKQVSIELARNYMPRVELQLQLDRIGNKLDVIDQQTRKQ